MKIFLILLFVFISLFQASAQSKLGIEGQIALSTDAKSAFMNFGGAGINFKFKKFDISVNMLPSLRFNLEKKDSSYSGLGKLFVRPTLGIGPQFVIKRFIITAPIYYLFNNGHWTFTFGIGYKILKF